MATETRLILIPQGSTFTYTFDMKRNGSTVVDLTGLEGRGSLGKSFSSNEKIQFDVTVDNSPASEITFSLDSNVTSSIKPGRYVFDIELFDDSSPSVVERILEGIAEVTASVSSAFPTGQGIGEESPSDDSP